MKKDINKSIKNMFAVAMTFTFCLVGGVPMIIGGAVSGPLIPVLAIGAFMTVVGFYGTPLAWVGVHNKKRLKRVLDDIEGENYRSISRISGHLGMPVKEVNTHVLNAINKQWLYGFTIDGDKIVRIENLKEEDIEHSIVCPNCGGINYVNDLQKATKCAYCGRIVEIE